MKARIIIEKHHLKFMNICSAIIAHNAQPTQDSGGFFYCILTDPRP